MVSKKFYTKYKGSFLPEEPWEGSVQSIYSKAINLLYTSGILISIVDGIGNMTDYGLTVLDFDSLLTKVPRGSKFQWKVNKIIFPDATVDISQASEWSGVLSEDYFEIFPDTAHIKSTFIKLASDEGLSPLITNKAGNIYSNAAGKMIKKAMGTIDKQSGIDLSFLVVMGIGFTPSGDDFLTGVMLYETISGINLINRACLRAKLTGTTEGGRTLLILALGNSFPFYLKQFAESILNKELSPNEVVRTAIMHGSTSGSDALTGFLWAAKKNEKTS